MNRYQTALMSWVLNLGLVFFSASALSTGDRISAFDQVWDEVMGQYRQQLQQEGVVGSTVYLASQGVILKRFYHGMADRDLGQPVDKNTLYHWASTTKTYTAVAVMQLVERKLVSLRDPVIKYIPEFAQVHNPFGRTEDITLYHLITHSAGLRSATWPWGGDESWHPHEPEHWRQLVAMFPYTEIKFKPGTQYAYSNPGISLLGQVIERVAGEDYEVYMEKNIFKPLGMHRSYFDLTPWYLRSDRSNAYWIKGENTEVSGREFDTGATVANGGLNATVADFVKFANFLAQPDSSAVLLPATLKKMWKPQFAAFEKDEEAFSIGYGFFLGRDKNAEKIRFVGHGGFQKAYRSTFYVDPDKQLVIVAVANTTTKGGNPSMAAMRKALVDKVAPLIERR